MSVIPEFDATSHASLRAAGLQGEQVAVSFANRTLELAGASGGAMRVEAARTARIRLGYYNGKYHQHFVAQIWLQGADKPLVIEPLKPECPVYGEAMRGFAAAVAGSRGTGAVERGIGGLASLLLLALPLLITVGFNVTAYILSPDENLWLWYGLIVFSWLLSLIALLVYFKRQRPRPVTELGELDAQLPPTKREGME